MSEHNHDPEQEETGYPKDKHRRLQLIMSWIIAVILTGFGVVALWNLFTFDDQEQDIWNTLIKREFPVIVALPIAGLGAMFITLILRISSGPLAFEIAGLRFRGGAAPIVFWVICFLSIVISIKMLWQGEP